MAVKTITFVRHAESASNAGGITMAHGVIPLTDLGRRQAAALADALALRPARIWVSAYDRTGETARPFLAKVGMTAEVHPSLHEFSAIDPSLLAGMNGVQRRPIADDYWRRADPAMRMGAEAETFAEFAARVAGFIARLDELPDQTLLFGHGTWFRLVVWRLLGFTAVDSPGMAAFRSFQAGLPVPNCATYRLIQSADGGWRVEVDERVLRVLRDVS